MEILTGREGEQWDRQAVQWDRHTDRQTPAMTSRKLSGNLCMHSTN